MKYQNKNEGISLLIAMGGSFLVLLIAFSILLSVQKMLSQMESLERSTKLFFAAESGIEAAFYHHNARGAGVDFTDISGIPDSTATTRNSQTIGHLHNNIEVKWTIDGRTDDLDPGSGTKAPIVGLLKEGQTVQIPLSWDKSEGPEKSPSEDAIGGTTNHYFKLKFYNNSNNMPALERAAFGSLFGRWVNIPPSFDFGKDIVDPNKYEILIDWSVSRKNSLKGLQTFSPKENDCEVTEDFICEDRLYSGTAGNPSDLIDSSSASAIPRTGRVLPGFPSASINLKAFMECNNANDESVGGGSCTDYVLTFRPLLKFEDSVTKKKIPGLPYTIEGAMNSTSTISIPKQNYTVEAVVSQGDFSQRVSIEVPEKTSIGAFDYVIFD